MHASPMRRSERPPHSNPMLGIINGVIGSLAIWALIATVVAVAS